MNPVVIHLSQDDAVMFTKFREHQALFQRLVELGVFETKNGSVTLHFDHLGIMRIVEQKQILYKL